MTLARFGRRPILAAGCIVALFSVSGCARDPIPFLNGPSPYLTGPRNYMSEAEVNRILLEQDLSRVELDSSVETIIGDDTARNKFVTAKMFIIDRNYNSYETNLAKENEFANFFGSLSSLGVSTAAATIPAGQTTKLLAAVVTGITGAKTAFDRDVLLTQTIQTVQSQMRTDRANQAKLLISRMACELGQYPLYMALTDLEAYRQAGTFESALGGLVKATAKAEADATASKAAGGKATSKAVEGEVQSALTALDTAAKAVKKLENPCPIPKSGA